jgi:hypothetical protein
MNIDNWIRDNFKADWIKPNPLAFVTHRIGDEFNFGEFMYQGHIERISEWRVIDTIGANNSCLIHSILTLTSNVYARMNRLHKIAVAERFRVYIKDRIRFTLQERNDLEKARLLPDSVGEKIAAYLGFNLVILKAQRDLFRNPIPNIIQTDLEDRRVLVIFNKGGIIDRADSGIHFEAVMRHDELIAQPAFREAILPLIQELLLRPLPLQQPEPPLFNKEPSRKASPPEPKFDKFKNMIECMKNKHDIIKHRARELGISDNGTKAKICNLILKNKEPSQKPIMIQPTTVKPTTVKPTTVKPTTVKPTTVKPTTVKPTTVKPTTVNQLETNPIQPEQSKPLCSPMRTKKNPGELTLPIAKRLAQLNGLSTKGTKSDICRRLAEKNLVRLSGRRSKKARSKRRSRSK